MSYGDGKAYPTVGAEIEARVKIRVGVSNGDFRAIIIKDHLGRPIADGDIPYYALRQIEENGKQ